MIDNTTTHPCRTCHQPFETWDGLADHVKEYNKLNGDPHKKDKAGFYWAKDYIKNRRKRKLGTIGKKEMVRTPLTKQQKQSRENSIRIISKRKKPTKTYCPKCKHTTIQQIEIEYLQSPQAVRNQQEILVVLCDSCRSR